MLLQKHEALRASKTQGAQGGTKRLLLWENSWKIRLRLQERHWGHTVPSGQVETPAALCSRQLCCWRVWHRWGFSWWLRCNVSWLRGSLLWEGKEEFIFIKVFKRRIKWQRSINKYYNFYTNLSGRRRCPCSSLLRLNQGRCRLVSPAPSIFSRPAEPITVSRYKWSAHLCCHSSLTT